MHPGLSTIHASGGRGSPSAVNVPARRNFWYLRAGERTPTISRQGQLAFTSVQKDSDIERLELADSAAAPRATGPPETVISSSHLDHTPQYSPDGRRIA